MQHIELIGAGQLSRQYGVKSLCHGGPGSGKTPLMATAPNPVVLATEPGMLSIRHTNLPVYEAYTVQRIKDFMAWLKGSQEAAQFHTVCIDSLSQLAETVLKEAKQRNKHGLKAYGEMAETVMEWVEDLYYMQNKHVYLVCKSTSTDEGNGVRKMRPYFPGNELNIKVPHMYDLIMFAGKVQVPGQQGVSCVLNTQDTLNFAARDRSARLAPQEAMDLNAIFAKCMS